MTQPNLFIVGAPKCGTSSLAKWLGEHPDVFLPSVKEPHHYNKDELQVYYRDRAEYIELYSAGGTQKYRLDASVWYLHSKLAVSSIVNDCPDAKFIVCLRNPVDMAFSLHRQFLNKSGREMISSFSEAWHLSDERLAGLHVPALASDPRYLAYKYSCRIGTQTERLLKEVADDKVKLIVFDDLVNHPEETLGEILGFLELPNSIPLGLPHENPGINVKYPWLKRFYVRMRNALGVLGIKKAPKCLQGIGNRIMPTQKKSQMSMSDRRMVTEYFYDEIQKIWSLVGTRYDSWTSCLNVSEIKRYKSENEKTS